jgi:hypothetical protein
MDFKKYAKWAAIAAAVFVCVQFSLAYVNRTQLKSIMESEALDARRTNVHDEEYLTALILKRAAGSNVGVGVSDEIEFVMEGVEDDNPDLIIYADYVQEVDLLVYKVYLNMSITARADAPDDPDDSE